MNWLYKNLKVTVSGNFIAWVNLVALFFYVKYYFELGGGTGGAALAYVYLIIFGYHFCLTMLGIAAYIFESSTEHRLKNKFITENIYYNIPFYIGISFAIFTALYLVYAIWQMFFVGN